MKIKKKIPTNTRLESFTKYCEEHPEQRFWQALRNWSEYAYIYGQRDGEPVEHADLEDTFY